eukprot:COSAG05_NODE_3292_length_2173_cov_1.792189_2_plen_289_part_00
MKRSEKNTLQHPGPAHAMANPWPRETFVIPGDAGQVARTINMIKVDDAFRTQLLTIFNGATSDQGPNTMPAIGPMGHTQGHVDFPIKATRKPARDSPRRDHWDTNIALPVGVQQELTFLKLVQANLTGQTTEWSNTTIQTQLENPFTANQLSQAMRRPSPSNGFHTLHFEGDNEAVMHLPFSFRGWSDSGPRDREIAALLLIIECYCRLRATQSQRAYRYMCLARYGNVLLFFSSGQLSQDSPPPLSRAVARNCKVLYSCTMYNSISAPGRGSRAPAAGRPASRPSYS